MGRQVFAGNFDRGIQVFVPNIDGALSTDGTAVQGDLAAKCRQVAPRGMFIPREGEAVLLYEQPDSAFLEYIRELYGYHPLVIVPEKVDDSQSLNLISDVSQCERSLAQLRELSRKGRWAFDPFIHDPGIYTLAREVGFDVVGPDERLVREGLIARLNDKTLFVQWARELGIPLPPLEIVRGFRQVVLEATRIFERDGRVHLRRANAAGGLGVVPITEEDLSRRNLSLEGYLLAQIANSAPESWNRDAVLVGEYLDIESTPSTLAYVESSGAAIRASSEQVVRGGAFYGSIYPWLQPEKVAVKLSAWTYEYAAKFARAGGRGYFNIDWGVTKEGQIVAFECNARYTGAVHPKIIAKRLHRDGEIGFVESNDAFSLPEGVNLSFEDAQRLLVDVAWSHKDQRGVVITIPPAGGTIGLVAIGNSAQERRELFKQATISLTFAGKTSA